MNTLSSTPVSDHHGILLSFGATIQHTFPLILIIGREPHAPVIAALKKNHAMTKQELGGVK